MFVEYLEYKNDNLDFLYEVDKIINYYTCTHKEHIEPLFRASELSEISRILKYGTDRGGFENNKLWKNKYPYEDVIYATTSTDIINAEKDVEKSSSFKKFSIIDEPILLIYDKSEFVNVDDRQWKFLEPNEKLETLIGIIILS